MSTRVITALTAKDDHRCAVHLDGAPWVVLDALTVRTLGLDVGVVLTVEEKRRIDQTAREERALARAATMISRRSHGKAELEQRVARRDGAEAARAATDRLAELGAVDDRRHAREVAQHRLDAGWGPDRIGHDLIVAGLADEDIRAALAEVDSEAIDAAARKAIGSRTGVEAWRRLHARGFDEDVAERLVQLPFDD